MKIKAAVLNAMGAAAPYAEVEAAHASRRSSSHRRATAKCWSRSPPPACATPICPSSTATGPRPMPMALGHEAAGVVEQLGDGVTDLKRGDHVVLVFVPSCGHCAPCAEGRPALVRARRGRERRRHAARRASGVSRAAARPINHHLGCSVFAEYATVSRRSVVKIDADAAARRSGAVRLRGAHRRRRGGQHRAGPGRRVGGGDRAGRRRSGVAARCARGRRAAHHRGRPVGRQARAGEVARRHAHASTRAGRLRRSRSAS